MAHDDWRFAIEIHPREWKCPSGLFWIAGWIMSEAGHAPVDVRARLGQQSFFGLCGLPRPEVEIKINGHAGPPHAGFSFLLSPHAGAHELRIEACDATGRWQEFFRQSLTVEPGAPAAKNPAVDVNSTLRCLLTARQANPSRSWADLAGDVLFAAQAEPLNSFPKPPFYGTVEQPRAAAFSRYGRIAITGWVAHRSRAIVRLTAFVDSAKPFSLLHGLPRSDLTGLFAELCHATTSRFAGYCALPASLPLPACLRIFAELDDGSIELAFAQRFSPRITTGGDAGLPPLSRCTFWRASRALNSAARRNQISLGETAEFREAKRRAWENYCAAAPLPARYQATPADPIPPTSRPLRVVLVTHNLNREGAPLIALEYARHLAAQPGWSVSVVSPEDGPLRENFLSAGIPVKLVGVQSLFAAGNRAEFDTAIREVALALDGNESDLIIANTMVAFWAVHVARHLRKPSLFYIHESASVRNFFIPFQIPALVPRIEEAFGLATRVIFSAAAACAIHARLERHANFRVVPGWIDVDRIVAYAAAHSVADLRRAQGWPADAVIFSNIGSVTDRKGQHVFIEAIDLLLRSRSARNASSLRLVFLVVGAAPSFYLELLRDDIARRQLPDVEIIEHVADADVYFRLSDIFVCSSFEEALPRVVMEAAAFRLPVVSTHVNGIPEILASDEAWLVPPNDPVRMAAAMEDALAACLAGDFTRAERGHHAVCLRFNSARLLARHVAVAASTADLPIN